MKNWWRTDEELMKNWWRIVEDYHRLPQTATDWLVLLHWTLKPISGSYIIHTIYIPDSTNYKSTASGANNQGVGKRKLFARSRENSADIRNYHAGSYCITAFTSYILIQRKNTERLLKAKKLNKNLIEGRRLKACHWSHFCNDNCTRCALKQVNQVDCRARWKFTFLQVVKTDCFCMCKLNVKGKHKSKR